MAAPPAALVDFDNNNQTKLVLGFSNGVLMLNLRRNTTHLGRLDYLAGKCFKAGFFCFHRLYWFFR